MSARRKRPIVLGVNRSARLTTLVIAWLLVTAGSLVGSFWGYLILRALENIPQAARFGKVDKLFSIIYEPSIFLGASGAAILATLIAAILPARRAAKLSPVEVIRG